MPNLESVIRPTTIIRAPRLNDRLGVDLTIASETFQYTGSFKFRAAYNVASNVDEGVLITASSGNFGQALAYACKLVGKKCIVVMPDTSAKVKIDAVRDFGANVDLVDVRVVSRSERVAEIAAEFPGAYGASAYDDDLVIQGNASLGRELGALNVDAVVVPIGGGGLAAGVVTGLQGKCEIVGAEPLMANDAARSFRAGHLIVDTEERLTLADGARTLGLGKRNWEILRDGLSGVIEVSEEKIREAVGLHFLYVNLKVEPTGALSLGAILTEPERFKGKKICCIVSGGNVDPTLYASLIG